ncbi:DsrE family protein [Marinomonas algicola]|jgi:tRNA 2-thiouridine synthesizing protein C|uniref:DsrE family protein n=1 Tax=Marinomonas algicola TaxID=2773454 RepID=UPI001749C01E|nr:DsrE family protein [Marinomonas algicola]
MKSFLIYLSSSPFSSLSAKEGLDIALVMATFEQPVDLFVNGPALPILYSEQKPTPLHGKNLSKVLPSLEFYDIENIYVLQEEIDRFSSHSPPLWDGITVLSANEWKEKLPSYEHIIRF